ncbi:hypothetical protein EF888_17025 [Silicimonas algicola]|uniref:hypothetical protein n=1 Tax=Silicimonas algicola TaxID=1826607 RepID=UPI000F84F8F5|nr:hypothetical protein [Silicimonas algicola]AZQ68680.1 hypothetical protein EF888_17025 [Silicimonas algicola]
MKKLHPAENVLGVHWPPPGSWPAWLRAAGLIVAASILKPLLEYAGGEPLPPYITFYPAVVIAAFGGGPIVGVVTALGTVVAAWVLYGSVPQALVNLSSEMIYTVTSVFLAWSVGRARLALELASALRERQEYTGGSRSTGSRTSSRSFSRWFGRSRVKSTASTSSGIS